MVWLLAWAGAATATAQNIALGKPVFGSGPTWPGLAVESLTDGRPETFSHPATGAAEDYYFEVDLGREYLFERIVIRNRNDGCCPERLTRYRVEVYGDRGGETGDLHWAALIRGNGSNSGVGGTDELRAALDPQGTFSGRFVRVANPGSEEYHPQLAEVEVYGAPGPLIHSYTADDDTLEPGGSTVLRWEVVNATGLSITPEVGPLEVGQTEVEVRPTVTTTYTLAATNVAGSTLATVIVGVGEVLAPPRLTEFLAANATGLRDEDGEASDWIELSNPNRFSLKVGDYFLTDDPGRLTKWRVPDRRIPAAGSLVIYASGKDRGLSTGELHTNFKLDAEGEYLALVAPDGTVLDQFPTSYPVPEKYPVQLPDISYGVGSSGTVGYFRPPTPGVTNGPVYEGIVAPISISHNRGFYDTEFSVSLATATPEAVIRYTIDRSEPTATRGLIYSAPISIARTTVFRAAAFRTGWAPTDVQTHTYVFLTNVINSSVMRASITKSPEYGPQMRAALLDVPSFSVNTTATVNGTSEVKASVELLRADGEPGFQEYCGIRNFGGAFTDFAKKSFRLYFRSEYGAGKLRYPLFAGFEHGLAAAEEFDQIELRSGSHDMEQRGFYLSNVFADDTLLEAGHLNPHGRFVHLYLNGTYWGLFHLRERWGAAMHASYLGGSRTNYESINGNWNVGGWPDPGVPYDGDGSIWTAVKAGRNQYATVQPWLDVPQYIDFMLTWMFGGAEDEYRCVGPNVPGSGFKFYLNDADGWFCVPNYCAADNRTARGSPGRQAGDGPGSIFSMLLKENNSEYRTLLADRVQRALGAGGVLSPERNAARLNVRVAEMERAFLAESARWGYLTPVQWSARRDSVLNDWLPRRTLEALTQFRGAGFASAIGAPIPAPPGGQVSSGITIGFPGIKRGLVCFTLDGTDPRSSGGAISPAAHTFQSGGASEVLVAEGARWRWFTDATGLDPSDIVEGHPEWSAAHWKHPEFNDRLWAEGPAQLGYGEGDEATVIPFGDGNNKWITSYFRRHFTVTALEAITNVTLRLKRDDGAVVYLNGREAARSAMGTGVITAQTRSGPQNDDGQTFVSTNLAPSLLKEGSNLIAVELHQVSPTSSDASFDLELLAERPSTSSGDLPVITKNSVLRVRTLEGGVWSGLVEAFYQVGPTPIGAGDVRVTEIHPHPTDPEGSEFIELANVSSHAVNLRGARFSEGVEFTFPEQRDTLLAPGQRLVLVSDQFQFQRRHGWQSRVDGIFRGRLNNAGESITLVDSLTNIITSFDYGRGGAWPNEANGGGYSLVLVRPELGLSNPAAWRFSALPDGGPGEEDSQTFSGVPEQDDDRDGVPALLEYTLGSRDDDPSAGPGLVHAEFQPGTPATLTFRRVIEADDVDARVEYSTDLLDWQDAARVAVHPTGTGLAEETWSAPPVGVPALYLRLRVSQR
ncbi:MAG TPA: lamin tail domain-containing protein [Verrucomicrobiota bacterium]|nr:lamin tail domain-containing protein [Verrucomicrobiota bacterium]